MACAAGIVAGIKPEIALLIIGLSALIVIALVLPLRAIVGIVIVSSFFSRVAILTFGFHVRPEHIAAILLLVKILFTSEKRRIGRRGSIAILAMSLIVVLNVVSTLVNSPEPKSSFDIVGWLFMDTILLGSLLQIPEQILRRAVLRTGLFCALVMGALAILFWGLAEAGGPLIGVQRDPAYGGYAAYVGSYEANVAAGILVLWGLVALASLRSDTSATWITRAAAIVCPLALFATDTRAAIIAYVVGTAILTMRGGTLRFRHLCIGFLVAALGVAVLSLDGSGSFASTAKKLSNYSLTSGDGGLRLQGWALAFHDMVEQQFILGLGTNSYGQRHFVPTLPGLNVPSYLGALPIQILYDAGGIALLCVVAVTLIALPRRRRARSLGYAMAVSYLLISLATSPFWFSYTWVFVALGILQRDLDNNGLLRTSRNALLSAATRGREYYDISDCSYHGSVR